MNWKVSATSKILLLCVVFTMSLLLVRMLYSQTFDYSFYGWNTFLAAIPYLISTQLIKLRKIRFAALLMLFIWLIFFPNAPYLVTDLLHYEERQPVPFWYDILLVVSATWNGLLLGLVSLMNVETFLARHLKPVWVTVCVFISLLLCSYGVFLGRFLRLNSWDIASTPIDLAYNSARHVLQPQRYTKLWVFTILLAVLLSLIYFTLKNLPKMREEKHK
jgi:uncharacterized membrane protein